MFVFAEIVNGTLGEGRMLVPGNVIVAVEIGMMDDCQYRMR
jgi:hypothetical protein